MVLEDAAVAGARQERRIHRISAEGAATLAHGISASLHLSVTTTLSEGRSSEDVLADIWAQVRATIGPRTAEALYTR